MWSLYVVFLNICGSGVAVEPQTSRYFACGWTFCGSVRCECGSTAELLGIPRYTIRGMGRNRPTLYLYKALYENFFLFSKLTLFFKLSICKLKSSSENLTIFYQKKKFKNQKFKIQIPISKVICILSYFTKLKCHSIWLYYDFRKAERAIESNGHRNYKSVALWLWWFVNIIRYNCPSTRTRGLLYRLDNCFSDIFVSSLELYPDNLCCNKIVHFIKLYAQLIGQYWKKCHTEKQLSIELKNVWSV